MNATLLYLAGTEIAALTIEPSSLRSALARAFRLHGQERTQAPPKQTLQIAPGHFFQSMCAAAPELRYAAAKWVGIAAGNAARGLSNVDGLVVLSDLATGRPLAIMDGNSLTVMRTAAMSALAAELLARHDSRSLGFVGCGQQAYGHLEALSAVLPQLQDVVCFSRSPASARALAERAAGRGLTGREASIVTDVLACDVVVTTVPGGPDQTPFLDARHVRAGSLAIAVDLGRSWDPASLEAFDLHVVDDRSQAADPQNRMKLAYGGPFDADLAALAGGAHPGRTRDDQRILFLFPGSALADLAVAGVVYDTATAAGAGLQLAR